MVFSVNFVHVGVHVLTQAGKLQVVLSQVVIDLLHQLRKEFGQHELSPSALRVLLVQTL
jgi:hypothetical protein